MKIKIEGLTDAEIKESLDHEKKRLQEQVNELGKLGKSISNKKFGGESALFFYDKFENYLFCFRTKDTSYKKILESFVKFEQYCFEHNENLPFDMKVLLDSAVKMEYVGG